MVLTESVAFDKWFDIIDPIDNNILSNFRIETTAMGDTLLSGNDLTNIFPAVVQDSIHTQNLLFFR